jgi:hypothetical protein
MKCYVTLPTDHMLEISQGIHTYIQTHQEILESTEHGVWHFVDCKELVVAVPALRTFFHEHRLIPRHAAVTVITADGQLPVHVDEPPVVAKINMPVLNTQGWANRWYDNGHMIAELLDMDQPVVFNSQIAHSVERTTATVMPRIVASFTFHNEPQELLR